MKVKPLNDRILVQSLEAAEKTSGGLYIPATAQEKTQEATVIAIGDSEDIKVKVDDRIIHDKYAGTNIKIDGKEYVFLKAEDILAIV